MQQVASQPRVAASGDIALGGDHACVLVMGGAIKCWGNNWAGQLGIGGTTDQYIPADVPGAAGHLACAEG